MLVLLARVAPPSWSGSRSGGGGGSARAPLARPVRPVAARAVGRRPRRCLPWRCRGGLRPLPGRVTRRPRVAPFRAPVRVRHGQPLLRRPSRRTASWAACFRSTPFSGPPGWRSPCASLRDEPVRPLPRPVADPDARPSRLRLPLAALVADPREGDRPPRLLPPPVHRPPGHRRAAPRYPAWMPRALAPSPSPLAAVRGRGADRGRDRQDLLFCSPTTSSSPTRTSRSSASPRSSATRASTAVSSSSRDRGARGLLAQPPDVRADGALVALLGAALFFTYSQSSLVALFAAVLVVLVARRPVSASSSPWRRSRSSPSPVVAVAAVRRTSRPAVSPAAGRSARGRRARLRRPTRRRRRDRRAARGVAAGSTDAKAEPRRSSRTRRRSRSQRSWASSGSLFYARCWPARRGPSPGPAARPRARPHARLPRSWRSSSTRSPTAASSRTRSPGSSSPSPPASSSATAARDRTVSRVTRRAAHESSMSIWPRPASSSRRS